jgi:hypothetical protein
VTLSLARPALAWRVIRLARDLVVGGLLCLHPVTAIIALGWLSRRMGAILAQSGSPNWLIGPQGAGPVARVFGGLAANIRDGMRTLAGLALLTLPFTALWLGAWWAGWENSFNKGYEQAAVGPTVWVGATIPALLILAHLPFALAHAAREARLGAFTEWRAIRQMRAAAGWRGPWLALVSVVLALPFLGAQALPAFVEQIVPGFARMSPDDQQSVAGIIALLSAAYSFASLYILRGMAARIAARPTTRARASRWRTPLWLLLSCIIWFGLVAQIVIAQFMNYDPVKWLNHPLYLLPWAG